MVDFKKDMIVCGVGIEALKTHLKRLSEGQAKVSGALIDDAVLAIKDQVLKAQDAALLQLTEAFDGSKLNSIFVTKEEIKNAYEYVSDTWLKSIKRAKENIESFHSHQLPKSWEDKPQEGVSYGWRFSPLDAVGLYVPGGQAIYPSSVLMNAIPAKLAGVKRTVMVSPPQKDGSLPASVLVAADLCGVDEIYKVGGAQAIFALAYGTQSVKKVDKIVGPGNAYVTAAKQMVYGVVDIDKPAGPSEVLVVVNDDLYIKYAAAEMLAQCEHDKDAFAVCVTQNKTIFELLSDEIIKQAKVLNRQDILKTSIANCGVFLAADKKEALDMINEGASEHLALVLDDAKDWLADIRHAGSIFCGPYSPVALGDYIAGPNHVLPTLGAARFASPLWVGDFLKGNAVLSYSKKALDGIKEDLAELALLEGLDGHNRSVQKRFE